MIDTKIIKIASNTKNYGLKKKRSQYAYSKNKICGDIIKVEVTTNKSKIVKMRYETESCIFCQASASILSNLANRINIKDFKKDINQFHQFHKAEKLILPKKYKLFKILLNKKYKNRFHCVMLPFNALIKALSI